LALAGMMLLANSTASAAPPKPAPIPDKYPQKVLDNGMLKLTIALPDAQKGFYRSTRFDWSGMVVRAEYAGHTFFDNWKPGHQPDNFEDTTGPAEEYGSPLPLGYAEAKPGEVFVKIGVGQLQKGNEPSYRFWEPYRIVKAGTWKVTSGPGWIEFRQQLDGPRGLGYAYIKRVELKKGQPAFAIVHTLENTGRRPLITNQYCHNFLRIDGESVGPSYSVRLPFTPRPKEGRRIEGPIVVKGHEISLGRPIGKGQSFYGEFVGAGKEPRHHSIIVENHQTGAGVDIQSTLALAELHFWGMQNTICPEPFIELNIPSGKKKIWTTTYRFFVSDQKND
jgi:hypothetical protein